MKINKYNFLIFSVILFTIAAFFENGLLKKHPEKYLIQEFRNEIHNKEKELSEYLKKIASEIEENDFEGNFEQCLEGEKSTLEDKGFGFLIYGNGKLQYWSDRAVSFYESEEALGFEEGLIVLPNGYYLIKKIVSDTINIYGLHLIKYNYSYENKYLENTFSHTYNLPDAFRIIKGTPDDLYPVHSNNGTYLFSVEPHGNYLCTTRQLYFPGFIYFIGLLILLIYFRRSFIESEAPFFLKLFFLGIALFLVYWLHLIFHIPKVFFHLDFFSPSVFALSNWLPSLGDFFLLAIFFLFWMFNFGKNMDVDQIQKDSLLSRKFIAVLLLLFSGSLYLLIHFLIRKLILNSTISFLLNSIIEMSAQSVLGIFSTGILILAVIFFTIRIIDSLQEDFKILELAAVIAGISLFLMLIQFLSIKIIYYDAILFFALSSVLASLFSKKYLQKFTLSYLIIFVSVASIYSISVFYSVTAEKQREEQKSMAITLVDERDPVAEVSLMEIQDSIRLDPEIPRLLIEEEGLIDHLQQKYFNSYFRHYDVRFFVCTGADSLLIEMDNRNAPCIVFFEDMIQTQGERLKGTNFYFMDNMNGRISYTGWIHYPHSSEARGISIFIELNSELLFEGIGFPELLINKSFAKPDSYKKFDYAKYYGGELTDKHGDYNYNFYIYAYPASTDEFEYRIWDGMEHLIYHTREENYVIVSRELFTFTDYLISFPYLFVFYLLTVLLLLFIVSRSLRSKPVKFDLKFRIQAAIILIVFVSLLLVALATVWYNIKGYKEKHQNDLNEKMISIAGEIDVRLEDADELNIELIDWLNRELLRLSNVFRTDVNIYNTHGTLIASSRPEIFNRGIVSDAMNSKAFFEIFKNFQINYFQPEMIGQMSYLSAYRPIINNRGQYLGVINLPYFVSQDRYSQELSTIIVAFINLYVLLLLASVIFAVFISNQITKPLVLIQDNLRNMELGKRNEPIYYDRNDEIGSLVKIYNKKVDELSVSAELLARSERESAWREMAKQIAHEIKNPLTPMKLNIQHLQRTRGKGKEYNEYIDRITSTLIEQIDNLSNIATEFSNFAKIPTAKTQVFKLTEQVGKVIDLFDSYQVEIEFHTNGLEYLEVNVDREQFSRAIINLLKNGIQSISSETDGKITVIVDRHEHMAVISVSDNGEGIPEEIQDRLFRPSFTTKTSGMGLGLAIVKNIVENFKGHVWFETKENEGSTFYIEIPIWEN